MLNNLFHKWHTLRATYHEILIQDCLDDNLKQTLNQKLKYHKQKLNQHHTA